MVRAGGRSTYGISLVRKPYTHGAEPDSEHRTGKGLKKNIYTEIFKQAWSYI